MPLKRPIQRGFLVVIDAGANTSLAEFEKGGGGVEMVRRTLCGQLGGGGGDNSACALLALREAGIFLRLRTKLCLDRWSDGKVPDRPDAWYPASRIRAP